MKGRTWLLFGAAVGVAIGVGKLAYFNGAATSLADTALRAVNSAGLTLIHLAARRGAPRRVIEGLTAFLGLLVPGATALLLVSAARATLRLRTWLGVAIVTLSLASFFYLPVGHAAGVAALGLAAAALLVEATGLLVATPLTALAALIATTYLPRLLTPGSTVVAIPVAHLHDALFQSAGSPVWLRLIVLAVAAVPFVFAGLRIWR